MLKGSQTIAPPTPKYCQSGQTGLTHAEIRRKAPLQDFCGFCGKRLPTFEESLTELGNPVFDLTYSLNTSPIYSGTALSTSSMLYILQQRQPDTVNFSQASEIAVQTRTVSAAQNREQKREPLQIFLSLWLYTSEYVSKGVA